MAIKDIIQRIDLRRAELGLGDLEVSRRAGNKDLIRNWRRAARGGTELSPRIDSLHSVAKVLQVTVEWLVDGTGGTEPARQHGFSDADAAIWVAAHHEGLDAAALLHSLAPGARRPVAYQLSRNQPGLALLRGDVLVIDQLREARSGDTVVVNFDENANGQPVTLVRRYLPPYLVGADATEDAPILTLDATGRVAILGTVEASFRPARR